MALPWQCCTATLHGTVALRHAPMALPWHFHTPIGPHALELRHCGTAALQWHCGVATLRWHFHGTVALLHSHALPRSHGTSIIPSGSRPSGYATACESTTSWKSFHRTYTVERKSGALYNYLDTGTDTGTDVETRHTRICIIFWM